MNPLIHAYLMAGLIKNGGKVCDVITGPCSCGGWHSENEIKSRIEESKKINKIRKIK